MTHEIEDIAFDENFEAYITPRGDLAGWSGRERFEGHLTLRLTTLYRSIYQEYEKETIRSKLEQGAQRVVDQMGEIVNIAAGPVIEFSDDKPNTVEVTIIYETGDEFNDEVQP